MRYFILSMFLLASCGGGGGSPNPTTPTTPTTPSVPAEGTLLRSGCSADYPGVKWFVYADGQGGEYRDRDRQSVECGYVPPPPVEAINTTGDRFVPVVFSVGTDETPDIEATLGLVSFEDGQVLILGDGRTGEGTVTINGDEWQYTIAAEPRCAMQSDFTDCQGYRYSGRSTGYIYYGEDDDRIVEWELAMIFASGNRRDNSRAPFNEIVLGPETEQWRLAQLRVKKYNEAYERSGVHIRYVLNPNNLLEADIITLSDARQAAELVRADALIVIGVSGCPGACGCAPTNKTFRENSSRTPVVGVSACGWTTDVHELGHAVGLAHGPQNGSNEAYGYIWRDFGHGWGSDFCGFYADIMSYDATRISHHNSQRTCREVFGEDRSSITEAELDQPSGSRDYADAAYHLNRVRYDVSLIYSDYAAQTDAVADSGPVAQDIIVDLIDDFANGQQMFQEQQQWMQQFQNQSQTSSSQRGRVD